MTGFTLEPLPVCDDRRLLPELHAATARALAQRSGGEAPYVHLDVQCVLQAHTEGPHHAYVMHLDGPDTGSVWARWTGAQASPSLAVLPDCPARAALDPDEACCLYAGHPGGHSYELREPRYL